MNKKDIYNKLKENPKNVRFKTVCRAADLFDFKLRGGKGSHRIYVREGVRELLNFQNVKGKAKLIKLSNF